MYSPKGTYFRNALIVDKVIIFMSLASYFKNIQETELPYLTVEEWLEKTRPHLDACEKSLSEKELLERVAKTLISLFHQGRARLKFSSHTRGIWRIVYSPPPPRVPRDIPEPFDYNADWWQSYSSWFRGTKHWRCEECRILLIDRNRKYLDTHHIYGTRHNDPDDLRALCIGCHAEEPGEHHRLKEEDRYERFMCKHGREWRSRRSRN